MFANLTTTQLTAFILGIVFSGIAVACSFFCLRWARKFKSKILACAVTTISPFIAISAWFFLIFSYVKGIKEDEIFNLFISMALSLVVCFMIVTISYVLFNKNKARLRELDKEAEAKEKAERDAQIALAMAKAMANNSQNAQIIEVENAEDVSATEPQEVASEVVTETQNQDDMEETLEEEMEDAQEETEEVPEELAQEDEEDIEEVEENFDDQEDLDEEDLDEEVDDELTEELEATPVEDDTDDSDDEE